MTNVQPRSTPSAEWLERALASFIETGGLVGRASREYCHDLAEHILNEWLQVESLEVEMLVKAARAALGQYAAIDAAGHPVPLTPETYGNLLRALAPFEKKGGIHDMP